MVSVIESACEGDLEFNGFCIFSNEDNLMPYLPFVEVIALPHLDAVKDMVTSIDHRFAIFIFKWTAWVYHYADASKQKGRVKIGWTLVSTTIYHHHCEKNHQSLRRHHRRA